MSADESLGFIQDNSTKPSIPVIPLVDQHQPYLPVLITTVCAILLVLGIIGNMLTCFVIIKNKHMHTATNYYLFSLAISDIIFLILGASDQIYYEWHKRKYLYGAKFCIFVTFLSETSTNASILVITAFTVERYIAICHPLKARIMSSLGRAIRIIFAIWCVSAVLAIPVTVQYEGIAFTYNDTQQYEVELCIIKEYINGVYDTLFVILFLLPMLLISALYILIGVTLKRSSVPNDNVTDCGESLQTLRSSARKKIQNSRRSVIIMLGVVVLAFFITWAPSNALRLMDTHLTDHTYSSYMVNKILYYIATFTYYLSAMINPIIYSMLSVRFRQAFKRTFSTCNCRLQQNRQSSEKVYSTITFRCNTL